MKHIIIGITGGIGSGKSTVLNILKNKYNGFILEADKIGHIVMEPDGLAYKDIVDFFGKDILEFDGRINRKKLGEIVFKDREKLEALNSFVHPNVKKHIIDEIKKIQSSHEKSLIFIEAALLLEDNYDKICDYLWYVYTDKEIRFNRVNSSRGMDRKRFDEIVSNQLSDEIFKLRCHATINNSKSIEDTERQISIELNKLTKED